MAVYLLRNSLNPNKVVCCTITFRQLIDKGDNGELSWLVEIGTKEPNKDGTGIIPLEYIHYNNANNLDEAIREATERIAQKVDWELEDNDLRPPYVYYSEPAINEDLVNIYSDVLIDIKDVLPAAGIDINSIEMTINGIDVTEEIEISGDPYFCRVRWWPRIRILDYY